MSLAYDPRVIVDGWVFTGDGHFHYSGSNLPLSEWWPGRTFCHLDEMVSRCAKPPSYHQRGKVCRACVAELAAMGETLPQWQEALR